MLLKILNKTFPVVGFVRFGEWQEMKVKTVASNFTGWLPGFGFTG